MDDSFPLRPSWKNIDNTPIVGKKRDPRIQDPVIFSGKIRKNRKNSEKQKKFGKILFSKKLRKNSEKYFEKFGNYWRDLKKKKGPHSNLVKKFGKIPKIRKNTLKNSENTENSEKYLGKFGKILKIRKITRKNSEKC